jgi:hypothetical protein
LKVTIAFPRTRWILPLAAAVLLSAACANAQDADPSAALVSALTAACKHDESQFAKFLTADNAIAFHALPADQRTAILKRFSLTEDAGHPLLSNDQNGRSVVRCEVSTATAEFHFGTTREHENLAFIPVEIVGGSVSNIGLVRESSGWKILSVGLMLFDIPQLSEKWAADETVNHENNAIQTVRDLQSVIGTYQRAFGALPESLQQLGPAPKNEVSPDQANLISAQLATGTQDGYRFRYRIVSGADGNPSGYEITAMPESYGKNGKRSFFLDAAGKIHAADKRGESSTADDPVLPQEPEN